MSKLNTPWSLDADAVRDNTGRIVVETINCGETFAEEIVKCVNGYADLEAEIKQADSDVEHYGRLADERQKRISQLEAELENCVLAKRQAENEVARFTAEGGNLRKRISELEAELSALKAELKAACTVTFEETEMGECQGDESAVPFEEHAEAVENAYKEGVYDARSMYHLGWSDSAAKASLDEKRKANAVPVTLRNAGQGNPLHDEDPTV